MWKKAVLLMAISTCMVGNVVAQSIIDVHCHNILPFYMEVLEKHNAAMDEGFPLPAWNVGAHLEFMDAGLPFKKHGYRDFILRFGGKQSSTRRWFRFSWKWLNKLLCKFYI